MRPRTQVAAQRRAPAGLESALAFWCTCADVAELWLTRHGGLAPSEAASRRLNDLVAYARAASPFYRRLYDGLPANPGLCELPPVSKPDLMARFDDWCTDPRIDRASIERFLADPARIGSAYLERYRVWKSSGTSGIPGIFVQDRLALAVYDALVAVQLDPATVGTDVAARLAAAQWKAALVAATGDHYASVASWERLRYAYPAAAARTFSALQPLAALARELEAFQPAMLASYPSVLALLAAEKRAGRLHIAPAVVWSGGEQLRGAAARAIAEAFGCPVLNEYGASECLSIAYECREGWMHLNSEWVILEPIDRRGHPVPPGELSHSVLVTNLANHVQPVIRYDLGDRVKLAGAPCACGNPLPAFRHEGRCDATLELAVRGKPAVRLPPLAVATALELGAGDTRFQIAQTARAALAVRFDAHGARERAALWRRAAPGLRAYLDAQGLGAVRMSLEREAPHVDARSGKLHAVVVEKPSRGVSPRTL